MEQESDRPLGQHQLSELNINLEDYKVLSNQISMRVDLQQKMVNYQLLLGGIVIAAGINLFGLTESSSKVTLIRFFCYYPRFHSIFSPRLSQITT